LQPLTNPGVQSREAAQVIANEFALELDTPSNTLFPDGKVFPVDINTVAFAVFKKSGHRKIKSVFAIAAA
jgi:hypothetical protein